MANASDNESTNQMQRKNWRYRAKQGYNLSDNQLNSVLMSGDGFPSKAFKEQLKECKDKSAELVIKHDSYISKINEIKSDLKMLSNQVITIKEEMQDREKQFELERVLSERSIDQERKCIKSKVENLERALNEKQDCLNEFNKILNETKKTESHNLAIDMQQKEIDDLKTKLHISELENETLRNDVERLKLQQGNCNGEIVTVNNAIEEAKQKINELKAENCRIKALLGMESTFRLESTQRYKKLNEKYEEQCKKLIKAEYQLTYTENRLETLLPVLNEYQMERNLLRQEVVSLKEKEDELSGQINQMKKDMYDAKVIIQEQETVIRRNRDTDMKTLKNLQESCNNSMNQLAVLAEENSRLRRELSQQDHIIEQNKRVIDSFRKWKEEQQNADVAMQMNCKNYEEIINKLLEEKKIITAKYQGVSKAYRKLQDNIERTTTTNSHRAMITNLYDYSDSSSTNFIECNVKEL